MNKEEKIGIRRDEQFIIAGHSLFEWLLKLSQSTIMVLSENEKGLVTINKQPDEIIRLDFDYKNIGEKFYKWSFSEEEWWELTEDEYLQFAQCCHTAHFYLSKQNYNIGSNRDRINWLYESISKKLDLNKLNAIIKKTNLKD